MAIGVITENPQGSREVYEQVVQKVAQNGEFPPPVRSSRSPARPSPVGA